MADDRTTRITALVDSTFELSLKELRSFLERECAGDPELRAEVERRILERDTTVDPRRPPAAAAAAALSAGDVVAGRYLITRLIGRGGMGEVYEAQDLIVKESVALKTLRADLTEKPALVKRFEEEIYLARKVTHPNVCRIYEVGVHPRVTPRPGPHGFEPDIARAPLLFFAMELLEGETLLSRIARKPLTRAEAFPIAVQLAEGLHAAHRAGIVHADFKSANVILVPAADGVRAVITDFGVARLDPSRAPIDEARTLAENVHVAGTLAYMSPEQLAGEHITAASDLYSFGIVLFEMASGERPFDDRDLIRSAMLRASGQPTPIRTRVPGIDSRWEGAIRRCLQKDPVRRFVSAEHLAAWFRGGAWRSPRYWTPQEWLRNSLALGVLLLVIMGGWAWWTRPYRPLPEAQRSFEEGVNALHSMTYETARQSLEQSVMTDPRFALAHASLARAYDELDYTERAKDSMLRAVAAAQESRLTPADERKLRAMQFMVSREYRRAAPILRQIEAEAADGDRAAAALESGWLAQQMDESDEATAAFQRALETNPSYAAARLRLGFMFGRQGGKDDLALAAFIEAEHLYRASGNDEGVTQTLLERANLLDRRNREREALPVIEQGLAVAQTVGNRFQEIRLRFLQATAIRDLGDSTRAADLTRQSIDMALTENMDNLAANGLIDLGNVYLRTGDLPMAEPHFRRALDTARRGKVRRIEARALLSLGSLCEQDRRPEEARQFVEAGLAFYRSAGFQRESVQAATVLGGVLRQLGEYEEGIRVLREALPAAVAIQDRRVEGQLRERLADHLRDRGDWPAALTEYHDAIGLRGPTVEAEYPRITAARLQWRLGQREEALDALRLSARFEAKNRSSRLAASIRSARAEIAYADGRLDEALALVGPSVMERDDEELSRQATLLEAAVLIRRGRTSVGLRSAGRAMDALQQAGLKGEAAAARLVVAEALLAAGARSAAGAMADEALTYFESRAVSESVWRAHLIAARASHVPSEVDAHLAAGDRALSAMRANWTPATLERYLQRSDIKTLSSGLR